MKRPVHALRRGDGIDVFERLRGFDLHDQQGFAIGRSGIGRRAIEVEIIVYACAIEAALPQRGEFHCLHQSGGLRGGIDQRDHQAGGPHFQQVIEIGGVAAAGADDAVDVREMVQRDHPLQFAAVPGIVFGVEPDRVVSRLRRVRRHHGVGVIHAGDTNGFVVAKTGAGE
jgi:hypothetical protein